MRWCTSKHPPAHVCVCVCVCVLKPFNTGCQMMSWWYGNEPKTQIALRWYMSGCCDAFSSAVMTARVLECCDDCCDA